MAEKEDKGVKVDRTDRATRLLVDGLDALAEKFSALSAELVHHREIIKTELAHYVSHRQLWAFLAIILGLGYWFYAQVKVLTDGIEKSNAASNAAQLEQQRKHDAKEAEEHEWLRQKVNGSSHFTEDAKPKRKER
jgi:hypothetical protein